jgi:hypothetical protein
MTVRSIAALAALTALALTTPLAAREPTAQPAPPAAAVAPGTVQQAGAALRDVTTIRETYSPQIASAKTDSERQVLQQRAMDEAAKAINDKGLTVDRYNEVMRQAQADRDLGDQVLAAARTPR